MSSQILASGLSRLSREAESSSDERSEERTKQSDDDGKAEHSSASLTKRKPPAVDIYQTRIPYYY